MNRKLLPVLFAASLFAAAPDAQAIELADRIRQAGSFGIGFGGGLGPSGLSAKYYFSKDFALQGVLGGYGWGYYGWGNDRFGGAGFGVAVDFLFEGPAIHETDVFELGWNIGPGVWLGAGPDTWFGISGSLGLEFNFHPVPIDIVIEYKPALRIVDVVAFNPVNFGAHVRIYFH